MTGKSINKRIMNRFFTAFCIIILSLIFSSSEGSEIKSKESSGKHLNPEQNVQKYDPGIFPAFISLVPGIVVHGAGHWAAGDRATAQDLLIMEGAGLALILAGSVSLFATGASRRTVAPSVISTIGGFALFVNSWLADVYGSTGGLESSSMYPPEFIEIRAGYRYIYDVQFQYSDFMAFGTDLYPGRFRFSPSIYSATDDENQRSRLLGAYRIYGITHDSLHAAQQDGSFIDFEIAGTHHEYTSDYFAVWTAELFINGRFDMKRLSKTLNGAFSEVGLGYGREYYEYDIPGTEFGEDQSDMLLMRIGFGVFLGKGDGEIQVYYNHRRDDFVGGISVNGKGAGNMGFVGIAGRYYGTKNFGIYIEGQLGLAYLLGIGVMARY